MFFNKKKKTTHQHKTPVEKITIGGFIKNLKPAHLWTTLSMIATLIGGAYTLGNMGITETIHNDVRQAQIDCKVEKLELNKQSTSEILNLKTEMEKLKIDVYQMQRKVNFLNDYVSYLLAKENFKKDPNKKQKFLDAEKKFLERINID